MKKILRITKQLFFIYLHGVLHFVATDKEMLNQVLEEMEGAFPGSPIDIEEWHYARKAFKFKRSKRRKK